jgi:hypothetical protein
MNTTAGIEKTVRPRRACFTRLCSVVAPTVLLVALLAVPVEHSAAHA